MRPWFGNDFSSVSLCARQDVRNKITSFCVEQALGCHYLSISRAQSYKFQFSLLQALKVTQSVKRVLQPVMTETPLAVYAFALRGSFAHPWTIGESSVTWISTKIEGEVLGSWIKNICVSAKLGHHLLLESGIVS
eukprot:1073313-Amphidinium_carterae.3